MEAAIEIETKRIALDELFVCLDVSGSIRCNLYPAWVMEDIKKIPLDAPKTSWILWGSTAIFQDSQEDVVRYLKSDDTLGGTEPNKFIELLPKDGIIDLHVYTDGLFGEYDVKLARDELSEKHPGLRIRNVVVTYVNEQLDQMNVGLSAIFEGHVMDIHRTRVFEGKKLLEFDAAPLDADVSITQILDDHFGIDKTEEQMTVGMHYLAQRFANTDPRGRLEIRRLLRERADAVNRQYRTISMTPDEEKTLLSHLDAHAWLEARKPFIGHCVLPGVKLMQAYTQKFLNETKGGSALLRISAYAPLKLKTKESANQLDEHEDVLLDHIMYLGLGKEAVIVLPVTLPAPKPEEAPVRRRGRAQPRKLATHVECGLAFDGKVNFDNTFSMQTLFQLRGQQAQYGAGDVPEMDVIERLAAQSRGEPLSEPETDALNSSASGFGLNPFTRQPMECLLLVPANADALPADRLKEIDAWNAHMMSRFVRGGRTMPSVPLLMALFLEKVFKTWEGVTRPEDKAEAERLKTVCRRYVSRMTTPLTFTVGLPVIIEGTFSTAARLACAVLQGILDPSLPPDVLMQFWSTIKDEECAAKVWSALCPYAGLGQSPLPESHFATLRALVSGTQYVRSARDARLRHKKGLAYSLGMWLKRLDQLHAEGCHPQRLRDEEKAARLDLFGVPLSEPLLCLHGVDADKCRAVEDDEPEVLCQETCRPVLLNKQTLDMWYVGLPQDPAALAEQSFHKAMVRLVRKRTKGKKPRNLSFPPEESVFVKYVSRRLRAAHLQPDSKGEYSSARLLPTIPCARLSQEIALVLQSYSNLAEAIEKGRLTRKRFLKALRLPRAVCAFEPCCEFIRQVAVTEDQRRWIDEHATHKQVGGNGDILCGRLSYRNIA